MHKKGKTYIWILAFGAALGGFLFGYDLALVSGAMSYLQDYFGLSEMQKGWVVSSAMLGAFAGPLLGMWVADKYGRKASLLFAAFLAMLSALGCAFTGTITSFVIWRIVGGVGIGLASVISPVYIAEVAPAKNRGVLVTTNQLAIILGILSSIIVAYGLSFMDPVVNWRWMFGSEAVPILFFFAFLIVMPNSPRWLILNGRKEKGKKILLSISSEEEAETEYRQISDSTNRLEDTGTFRELFKPGLRMALFVGILVMIYNQIVGTTILHMYAPSIMQKVGIGSVSESIFSVIYIDVFMLICTIAAFYLIDKIGRKSVLYIGFISIAFGHLLMAASIYWNFPPIFALIALCISIGAHSLTLGPIPWSICTEIFPNRIRAKAMSITMIGFYFFNWAGNTFFPQISAYFTRVNGNDVALYLILVLICISGIIFTATAVPETKGIALEDVGEYWKKRSKKNRT